MPFVDWLLESISLHITTVHNVNLKGKEIHDEAWHIKVNDKHNEHDDHHDDDDENC